MASDLDTIGILSARLMPYNLSITGNCASVSSTQ
jgi:hypothetical protein